MTKPLTYKNGNLIIELKQASYEVFYVNNLLKIIYLVYNNMYTTQYNTCIQILCTIM